MLRPLLVPNIALFVVAIAFHVDPFRHEEMRTDKAALITNTSAPHFSELHMKLGAAQNPRVPLALTLTTCMCLTRIDIPYQHTDIMRTAILFAIVAISVGAQAAYAAGDVTKLQIGVKVRVLMRLITLKIVAARTSTTSVIASAQTELLR